MKLSTKQIKQMIVEELRSLMEQEKSYEGLLDAMEKESKEGAMPLLFDFLLCLEIFGKYL